MDEIIEGFLTRNVPKLKGNININLTDGDKDYYKVTAKDNELYIEANSYVPAFNGLYNYLQKYCNVQLSWCGNRHINVDKLVMFDGVMSKVIEQKYRVYMNYCTLDYSMCWWDFARWEKEIDFMAMNGINMPLAVIGSEAVWYETLIEYGVNEDDALNSVTGPAFYAWHLMTNIDSYLPPPNKDYIYERLDLGKKLLKRYLEFGMYPIEQGFSGHVPMILKSLYPNANILPKKSWSLYPETAQLDPLDPLFMQFGLSYLKNMERLLGNYHFIACDPFHEGVPPKPWRSYLKAVGKTINNLYETFDKQSIWVMQGWTPRKHIIKAVPKDRLLILDLNSERTMKFGKFYGYKVVAGMLHNFGGKNAMQGKIRRHTANAYKTLKEKGVNVVGSGMFMEGIEQNPVVYDLQFHMLTESNAIDFDAWLDNYIKRRYGIIDKDVQACWEILINTCYNDGKYQENEVGSTLAARPQPMPVTCGPCCYSRIWYDTKELEKALLLLYKAKDKLSENDGYQYDLCDITRQVMSNKFHDNEMLLNDAFNNGDVAKVQHLASMQLDLLLDLDELLGHRSELCLERWICDSHALATNEEEKHYFDKQARTLITLWGDINKDALVLYDYSWREWHGLIKDFYRTRWSIFYNAMIESMKNGEKFVYSTSDTYKDREKYNSTPLGRAIFESEKEFGNAYREYDYPVDSDVIPSVTNIISKWNIGK